MREERLILVKGREYTVVISDEREALLEADAAGKAIIGLWHGEAEGQDLAPARYLVESEEGADQEFMEKVVCRTYGIPRLIAETDRLILREFSLEDLPFVPRESQDKEPDRIFYTPDKLAQYIECQYGFYEYGLWALEEKKSHKLVGKAGVSGLYERSGEEGAWPEIGYHIFKPYRHQGYATEVCRKLVEVVRQQFPSVCRICARIDASNEASIRVAESCGFRLIDQKYNEAGQCRYLFFVCS